MRTLLSAPLFVLPGPCTTFDDAEPPSAGLDAGDGAPGDATAVGPEPYLSLEDAARVCSHVIRCPSLPYSIGLSIAVPVSASSFATCVHQLASPVPPSRPGIALQRALLARIAAASTCAEALAATPSELLYGGDPRCPDAGTSRCYDESHSVFCGRDGLGAFSRCEGTRGGGRCTEVDVPDAGSIAVCVKGPCEGFVPEARCVGTTLETCDPRVSKVATTFDCAWLGLRCGVGTAGYHTCIGADGEDASCAAFGLAVCEGDRARYCTGGDQARWSNFECAEIGARCTGGMSADGGGGPPFCLHREAKCSPLDAEMGECSDGAIRLCVDGAASSLDCARIGKQCDRAARACL